MEYQDFLEDKIIKVGKTGFEISRADLHESSLPHQCDTIEWAAGGGCRAVFASFGLGKTHIQLELARLAAAKKAGHFSLIICPLGVKGEFKKDAVRLGIEIEYVKCNDDIKNRKASVLITNYERVRDGNINPKDFPELICISLDEASVLRSYGSKTYQEFLPMFSQVPYRYVCTATPSPNKYKELIHYAGFLGIMDTGQALTRWFKRDSTKANNLTLYPHKEREFWLWVSSWAMFITKPSDLGYSDEGYDLPPLNIHWHCVTPKSDALNADRYGQLKAFKDQAFDLSSASKEKRESIEDRLDKVLEIVKWQEYENERFEFSNGHVAFMRLGDFYRYAGSQELFKLKSWTLVNVTFETDKGEEWKVTDNVFIDMVLANKHWLIWHNLEKERESLEKAFKGHSFYSVYGSQTEQRKEELLSDFAEGEYEILATKPDIAGQGCNFQRHCHSAVFMGIDYKFNDFIQAIHRIQRFQQKHTCDIHIIYTESEEHIRKELEAKWARHYELVNQMTSIIREYGLSQSESFAELKRSMGSNRREVKGANFTAINNDCVLETQSIESDSMGMILTSIPFSNHYEYTPSYNDFGHTNNDDHFFAQMDFLTKELHRVLKPGRVAAIHVKDRIMFGNVTGYGMPSVNPFHAKAIFHFIKHGFIFFGQITIETDVVRENNQTYRLGWSEQCKDGSKMGVGSPEYLLLFRKLPTDTSNAYADEPVTKTKEDYTRGQWQIDARAKWNSSGNTILSPDEIRKLPVSVIGQLFADYFKETPYSFNDHVATANTLDEYGKLPSTFEILKVPAREDNVWDDVVRMKTLNSQQTQSKEQNHICPFQIDVVERAINRWTNPGDIVLDPFGGLMTVPYIAIQSGRKGYGIELNPEYFDCGVRYCKSEELKQNTPTLFDLVA